MEALFAQGLIKAPIVSFKIPRFADRANDGEITFGCVYIYISSSEIPKTYMLD